MASHAEEIRRQLEESARVKQSFSNELVGRVAQFAEKSASALRAGGKIVFLETAAAQRMRCISPRNWLSGCARNAKAWPRLRSPRILRSSLLQEMIMDSNRFIRARSNRWWARRMFWLRSRRVETVPIFCAASKQDALGAPTLWHFQAKLEGGSPAEWTCSSTFPRPIPNASRKPISPWGISPAR
jgi:hypothetical protein